MSNEAPSRTSQTNQIRTACRELERALEVFNRTEPSTNIPSTMTSPASGAATTAATPPSNQDATESQLRVIHEQLIDIRRQLDELS